MLLVACFFEDFASLGGAFWRLLSVAGGSCTTAATKCEPALVEEYADKVAFYQALFKEASTIVRTNVLRECDITQSGWL